MTGTKGTFDRDDSLGRLPAEEFDVLVVGAGVTGAGVALDAASRGLRVALVERDDFASGTSSKSSKLVHGGLRYLQQGDVRLVYEALRERKRLRRNAPHLVSVLPFMIPVLTKDGVVSRRISRALGSAMWMYDLTGGWRIGKLHRRLRSRAAAAHFPTMRTERLSSAYLYFDAEADDARLCLALVRTAADHGAVVANRCAVESVASTGDGAHTVRVRDGIGGGTIDVRARCVVNATGVWADEIRALDEGTHPRSIRPAKGVHLTVPWDKVRNDIAVVIPVPRDRRSLFVVPWVPRGDGTFQFTYVGTTDTDWQGSVDDPQCTSNDIDYVLNALNASVTVPLTRQDVTGTWAGLRPLVVASSEAQATGRTADLSRRHSVTVSTSGVVTVTGGKLTTYREMAEDAVDEVCAILDSKRRCRTRRLPLRGARGSQPDDPYLRSRHGSDAAAVLELVAADPSLGEPLVPGLPYLRAEAVHAVRHEMAVSVDDVLTRRTRARLQDRAACVRAARSVGDLIAIELGWDDAMRDASVAEFLDECAREDAAARVDESEYIASTGSSRGH
jgi:glycerol-3-phosphate dehydrogenase